MHISNEKGSVWFRENGNTIFYLSVKPKLARILLSPRFRNKIFPKNNRKITMWKITYF